jgi:SAM-dependent methyltransferase
MAMMDWFWTWPDGWVWRVTRKLTERSRRARFELFMKVIRPTSKEKVIDVGAGEGQGRDVNFFEAWYPWRKNVVAVALEDLPVFRKAFPSVKLVLADGCDLPFPDNSFDVYFSNAVLEHVGSEARQRRFIAEACRVATCVFISTPNRWFPVDAHTLIPFAHWLPMRPRNAIYRFFHRSYFASEERLRLIGVRDLKKMLPPGVRLKLYPQRLFGMVANINVVLERG